MGQAPSYGLDWFEGAYTRPDLVLQDFAAAVRPASYPVHPRCSFARLRDTDGCQRGPRLPVWRSRVEGFCCVSSRTAWSWPAASREDRQRG